MRLGDIDEDEIVLESEKVALDNSDEKETKKKDTFKIVMEYLVVVLIGALIALFLTKVVIINAEVPTGSMKNTINEGDRVLGLRLTYYFNSPERGDIVIFKCPEPGENYNKLYVKRVIGLPGETIEIKAGQIWVTTADGDYFMLEEEYLKEVPNEFAGVNNAIYPIPEGEYFTLGDNRNSSNDSRYWGTVEEDRILAKVMFRYFPGFEVLK